MRLLRGTSVIHQMLRFVLLAGGLRPQDHLGTEKPFGCQGAEMSAPKRPGVRTNVTTLTYIPPNVYPHFAHCDIRTCPLGPDRRSKR